MRVFVYEWTGCVPDAPASLRREGWAMLQAVLEDFQKADGVQTSTLVSEAFPHVPPGEVHRIAAAGKEETAFREQSKRADATIVIAPETDGILDARCAWVESAGGRLLGPTGPARRVTASKRLLAALWHQCGVPTPAIIGVGGQVGDVAEFPVVLKPDDGAGSQVTFLVRDSNALGAVMRLATAESPRTTFLAQRFVAGTPASIAFLVGPNGHLPLVAAAQYLSPDGRFRYLGGSLPLPSPLAQRALALGRRAVQSVEGLCGFIGVDLVLGDADDGSRDYAIEVNPRLTTSYIGLRKLTEDNLAWFMLRVGLGEQVDPIRWRHEAIRFHPDGSLESGPVLR